MTAGLRTAVRAVVPVPKTGLRTDIQALRAIAVGSVMMYHLWPNRLTGGYVGVDVFFVISGFLITSHLIGEIDRTGRLRPAQFLARRAKRLAPASTVVLLASLVAVLVWVPRFAWHQFLTEIAASSIQIQNWVLAHNSVDYLASTNPPSPAQHFWTLAVEEQFYVGLPVLLLLGIGASRLLHVSPRRVLGPALVLVAGASLVYCLRSTSSDPGLAYFSTFTRAWEFAVGALLAFLPKRVRRPAWLAWAGLAGVVIACVSFTAHTAFPGAAAMLPVFGTAAAIWAGQRSGIAVLGSIVPIAFLGRVSYAAYLWHWPMIVVLPYATHHALSTRDKVGVIVATLLLSWLSTRFLEEPVRFSPRLLGGRRPRFVAAWALAAMTLVVGSALVARHNEAVHERQVGQAVQHVVQDMPRCLGAQSLDPALAPCINAGLAGVLLPDPAAAAHDDSNRIECWGNVDHRAKLCHLGPSTGYTKTLYAIGDSHNNTLIGVYEQIARTNNWRIDVSGSPGCYYSTAAQVEPSAALSVECGEWRTSVTSLAARGHYDAIIVTHSDRDRPVIPAAGRTRDQTTVAGLAAAWNQLPDVPIIAIRDNPSTPDTTLACVDAHRQTAATDCPVPRGDAVLFDGQADAAKRVSRARVVDVTRLYCTATSCPPVIGHVLVYRDHSHITATYATTLAPYLDKQIVSALRS